MATSRPLEPPQLHHYELGSVRIDVHAGGGPAVLRPTDRVLAERLHDFVDWFRDRKALFDDLALKHGALIFRGFPTRSTADFQCALDHYPANDLSYAGGASSRARIAGRVMESTQLPRHWPLMMHQEMAYLPRYPRMISFFCHVAPLAGGETLVADFREVERRLPRRIWDGVAARGVRYERNFRNPQAEEDPARSIVHRPWSSAFATNDPREAEDACRALGLEPIWESDGSLTTRYNAPGFVQHPATGQTIWFNHIASQTQTERNMGRERYETYIRDYGAGDRPKPYSTTYGDGGEIDPADIEELHLVIESITQAVRWEQGDFMLIDNIVAAHGRAPFDGDRDIQVMLLG